MLIEFRTFDRHLISLHPKNIVALGQTLNKDICYVKVKGDNIYRVSFEEFDRVKTEYDKYWDR